MIGGISVSCTQGLGACILTTIRGQNQVSSNRLSSDDKAGLTYVQFKNWFTYFLLVFVACTLRKYSTVRKTHELCLLSI